MMMKLKDLNLVLLVSSHPLCLSFYFNLPPLALGTVLVKMKTRISCFMEKLSECIIKNFMEKKKITWRNGEK